MNEIITALLEDPEIQEMIVDVIIFLLGFVLPSAVIIKARGLVKRFVPLLVIKAISARNSDHSKITSLPASIITKVDLFFIVFPFLSLNLKLAAK